MCSVLNLPSMLSRLSPIHIMDFNNRIIPSKNSNHSLTRAHHNIIVVIIAMLTLRYSIMSIATFIFYHRASNASINIAYLLNIMCILVAIGVISWRLECMWVVVEVVLDHFGLVYIKEEMYEWLFWSSRSCNDMISNLHYPLPWSNGFCGERGNKGLLVTSVKGPWHRIVGLIFLVLNFSLGAKCCCGQEKKGRR